MSRFDPNLLERCTGGLWTAKPAAPLTGFSIDTRQLRAGQVFVALKTGKRDGHDFILAAEKAGASAAIVSRRNPALALPQLVVKDVILAFQAIAREHRHQFSGPVIGITGSCGKTSTKDMLALLLGGPEEGVLATEGNLNNQLGVPLTLTRIDPEKHRYAVVEAGIGAPGEMDPLVSMIEPDIAIVTLVAPAHLEALGGVEEVAREKAKLTAAVPAAGVAIFPKDCARFGVFHDLEAHTLVVERAEAVRPAEPPKNKVFFAITDRDSETAIALAYGPPPPLMFTMRRVSPGMAQNAVLAICAALWLGIPREQIQERLARWRPVPWRGEIRHEGGRLLYLDCYNANPASMADALDAFAAIAPANEPRLYVLGCMEELGASAARWHRDLGHSLKLRPQDCAVVIGSEAGNVVAGALEAGHQMEQIETAPAIELVAARIAEWRGAVFMKGSRRYELEKALVPELAGSGAH